MTTKRTSHHLPNMTPLVIIIGLLKVSFTFGQFKCPNEVQCQCENSNGQILNCRNRNLQFVPPFAETQLEFVEVTLSRNQITSVAADAFKMQSTNSGLSVDMIDLSNNPITSVDQNAFRGVENLEALILHVNEMTQVPSAVRTLTMLENLTLEGFNMQSLNSGALSGLNILKQLILENNKLTTLRESDFTSQVNSLVYVDLNGNQFTSVPSNALKTLRTLTELSLRSNTITTLGANTFEGFNTLQTLDISRSGLSSIDSRAFNDVADTLTVLKAERNSLHSSAIVPIGGLVNLRSLDLSHNSLQSIPDDYFSNMNKLNNLNLQGAMIASIKKETFAGLIRLGTLNLGENTFNSVGSKPFENLHALTHLDLEKSLNGALYATDIFTGLEDTLKYLNLRETSFGDSDWRTVQNLAALQTLTLHDNSITTIPDGNFQSMNDLSELTLSQNSISVVTQSSLNGLQNSLETLILHTNAITTLDECVFYEFTKLKPDKLNLNNNQLHCDCELKWLRTWLNVLSEFERQSIGWKCASPPQHAGKWFRDISEDDFTCASNPEPKVCGSILPTSTVAPSTIDPPAEILVNITDIQENSLVVHWKVEYQFIQKFYVTHKTVESIIDQVEYPPETRSAKIEELEANTEYNICVEVYYTRSGQGSPESMQSCQDTKTLSLGESNLPEENVGIIIGAVLGVVAFLFIIGAVAFFVVRHRKRKEEEAYRYRASKQPQDGFPTREDRPRLGYNSKRFSKAKPNSLTNSLDMQNMNNAQMEKKLDGFTPEERDRIMKLLTASNASTMSIVSNGERYIPDPHGAGRGLDGGYINPSHVRDSILPTGNEYEVIPADQYDYIPFDKIDPLPKPPPPPSGGATNFGFDNSNPYKNKRRPSSGISTASGPYNMPTSPHPSGASPPDVWTTGRHSAGSYI